MKCRAPFAEGIDSNHKYHTSTESLLKGAVYWKNRFLFGLTISEKMSHVYDEFNPKSVFCTMVNFSAKSHSKLLKRLQKRSNDSKVKKI